MDDAVPHGDRSGEPAHGKVTQNLVVAYIDYSDGIYATLSDKEPVAGLIVSHPERQQTAQTFQAVYAKPDRGSNAV